MFTPNLCRECARQQNMRRAAERAKPPPPLARDLVQADGSLKCPQCGSSQFETKISTGRKVAFGVGSLFGSGNEIQCFACGAKYKRG